MIVHFGKGDLISENVEIDSWTWYEYQRYVNLERERPKIRRLS